MILMLCLVFFSVVAAILNYLEKLSEDLLFCFSYGSLMQLENMYKMDLPFDMPEISYSKEDIEIRTKRLQTVSDKSI